MEQLKLLQWLACSTLLQAQAEAPFVKVGQTVSAGETLGIIEAMKIMNPIEATQSGVIEEILVKNGEVIQFGQPLFRYRA